MTLNKKFNSDYIFYLFILIFSISVNQYYGFFAVNPLDNFTIYHSGNLILNGQKPFEDYWVTTGLTLDIIQYLFFKFFGTSWSSYVLHASFVNTLYCLLIYIVLRSFKLQKFYCLFYSILSAILFYPVVGTPFVDHHSIFFSVSSILIFFLAIKKEDNQIYWFFIPVLMFLGFLSKQTPSTYVLMLVFFSSLFYSINNKKFEILFIYILSSITILILFLILLKINKINFINFYTQYISFPSTIGSERAGVDGFLKPFSFSRYFIKFKYIHLVSIPIIISMITLCKEKSSFLKNKDFLIILNVLLLSYIIIIHQLLTLNSKFNYFIIPLIASFSHIFITKYNIKFSKHFVKYILFIVVISSTYYGYKYVHNRGFLVINDLYNKDKIFKTNIIDKSNLKFNWLTHYNINPEKEVEILEKTANLLKKIDNNSKEKYLLITDYQFIFHKYDLKNAIIINKLYGSGISYPSNDNKYFKSYRDFFIKKLKKFNISNIYFIIPSFFNEQDKSLKGIFDKNCKKKTQKLNLIKINIDDCF